MSIENETFEGAEASEPKGESLDRTAIATLKRFKQNPVQQYVRFEKYVESLAVRKQKLVSALSPETLELIQRTRPELLG